MVFSLARYDIDLFRCSIIYVGIIMDGPDMRLAWYSATGYPAFVVFPARYDIDFLRCAIVYVRIVIRRICNIIPEKSTVKTPYVPTSH